MFLPCGKHLGVDNKMANGIDSSLQMITDPVGQQTSQSARSDTAHEGVILSHDIMKKIPDLAVSIFGVDNKMANGMGSNRLFADGHRSGRPADQPARQVGHITRGGDFIS